MYETQKQVQKLLIINFMVEWRRKNPTTKIYGMMEINGQYSVNNEIIIKKTQQRNPTDLRSIVLMCHVLWIE